MTFSIDNLEGVATTPLRKICLGKTLRITRVKATRQHNVIHHKLRINHAIIEIEEMLVRL